MTLEELDALIKTSRSPKELFGVNIDASLRKFQIICHPDKNPGDPRAEALFKLLGSLAEEARKPLQIITSPKRKYELLKLFYTGDASDLYLASSGKKDYLLKVSRIREGAALLETERKALTAIHKEAGDSHYSKYFPLFSESFPVRDKFQKRINVYGWQPGFYSLEQVKEKHKHGLEGRHLAWIFKRLLTAIGFAHQCGWIHTAVLPSHVMLNPENHGLQLAGWGQAVEIKAIASTISTKYKNWYPLEVLDKKPPTAATDIYLAVKCLIFLAGGDVLTDTIPTSVPKEITTFFRSCLFKSSSMRPGDAWALLEEFDEVLKRVYGPPKFVSLTM